MRILSITFILIAAAAATPAKAEEVVMQPVQAALAQKTASEKLDSSIKFYFGQQPSPQVRERLGEFVVNPKTNAFGKPTGSTCDWVFLSAMIALQNQAKSVGANAVINIHSFYKQHDVSSDTHFECHRGFLMAGVALRGEMVRIAAP